MKRIRLKKNLRRQILQGNPWLYQQAFSVTEASSETELCEVKDAKGEFVAWGMYTPNSPIGCRILSFAKNPPKQIDFEERLKNALKLRESIRSHQTNTFRLINGEGDLLPGLVCDLYDNIAVLQFDGPDCFNFWDENFIGNWLLENGVCKSVYHKVRHDIRAESKFWGAGIGNGTIEVIENGNGFVVDYVRGQKTGFFIDQRDNRQYVQSIAKNKSVLNVFSYTGGFSVAAGKGGAQRVVSIDVSAEALTNAKANWDLNELQSFAHDTVAVDAFEYLDKDSEKFDIVICDPPSLIKSESHRELGLAKYLQAFTSAAKKVNVGGHLCLSSCSSHLNHSEFYELTLQALSKARRSGRILRVSGQGSDHPFPAACPELRYLKFIHIVL